MYSDNDFFHVSVAGLLEHWADVCSESDNGFFLYP